MKRASVALVLVWGLLTAGWAVPAARARQDVREAIVKIYTVHNRPNYYNPWSMYGPRSSTGSGAIVKGQRILTNAHVVSDQTFIQVRRHGTSRRFQARLVAVSHDADLALLSVDDPDFFEGVEPLDFGPLPNTQQEVLVYGFPLGGDTLSITKGVISRLEHQQYAHSSGNLLAGQIDAAINPGNSGGPVIVDGQVVGVVMQSISQAENIGYMVPATPIADHFFEDIADGRYDGFPSLGVVMQELESEALKAKYGVPEDETGILLVNILPGSPADGVLKEGDVVVSIDGVDVGEDGTVEFRPRQRTQLSYFIQQRQIGEALPLEILRDGERIAVTVDLDRPLSEDRLIQMEQYDILPTYFIYGGIVFAPLTKNLLLEWGPNWYNTAPKELVAMLSRNYPTDDRSEVVLALKVLADEVNEGYHEKSNWVVEKIGGRRVRNLRDLIDAVESATGDFVEFEDPTGQQIVLRRAEAEAAGARILAQYRITADRSPDLEESGPEEASP